MFSRFKTELVLGALVVLGVGVGFLFGQRRPRLQSLRALPDRSIIEWQLEGRPLTVEVVNTPASITQGLSDREQLDADGMLFVFPEPTQATFWMKDMRFPIDIVWISDERVVGVERNVLPPRPGTSASDWELFSAPQPIEMVLETIPGWWSE